MGWLVLIVLVAIGYGFWWVWENYEFWIRLGLWVFGGLIMLGCLAGAYVQLAAEGAFDKVNTKALLRRQKKPQGSTQEPGSPTEKLVKSDQLTPVVQDHPELLAAIDNGDTTEVVKVMQAYAKEQAAAAVMEERTRVTTTTTTETYKKAYKVY